MRKIIRPLRGPGAYKRSFRTAEPSTCVSVEALLKTNVSLWTPFTKPPDQEIGMSLIGAYNRALGRIEKLQTITASSLSSPDEIEESTYDLPDKSMATVAQRAPKLFHQQADLSA